MHVHQQFPVQGANHSTRKAPIPRPWLKDSKSKQDGLDILGEPRWEFSISKLSTCCFGKKTGDTKTPLHAPFQLIRRNSSRSFPSYELNSSDGSESVSDFTDDSDATSISMSLPPSGTNDRQQSPESPPQTTAPRPPMLGTRSRSTGLPPLNPNSTFGNSPVGLTQRNRCDTGEYTKTSTTSTASRHRRKEQFDFSPQSLSSIWSHESYTPRPTTTPPVEVHFPDGDYDHLQCNSSFASDDASGFEGWSVGHDAPISSSMRSADLRAAMDEVQKNPAARPPRPDRPLRTKGRKKKFKPEMSMPVYLRKIASLDEKATGNLVLSGWVAASLYDDALETRLKESSKMTSSDIFYMQIMEDSRTASIDLHDPSGILVHQLVLKRDWSCSSREITSRIGKMVVIESPIFSILRLLPISLEDVFFNGEALVSSKEFSRVQSMLFASGSGKVYAPDEQHDAAMFILFSLDGLVKRFGI